MDVAKAVRDARVMLNMHGLTGWTVALDNGKRRAGACNYRTRTIQLSRYLTSMHTEAEIRLVVLHEIAHALCPGHDHDEVWRRKCLAIGGDGRRTHSMATVPGRYVGSCPACSFTVTRHRASKAIKAGASCPKCGPGRYVAKFRLVWVDRGLAVR